jgi:hypothetical protein
VPRGASRGLLHDNPYDYESARAGAGAGSAHLPARSSSRSVARARYVAGRRPELRGRRALCALRVSVVLGVVCETAAGVRIGRASLAMLVMRIVLAKAGSFPAGKVWSCRMHDARARAALDPSREHRERAQRHCCRPLLQATTRTARTASTTTKAITKVGSHRL